MACPPFEMFEWNRLIVDEFTYLDLCASTVISTGLRATNRWCLSGTTPIKNFNDVQGDYSFGKIQLTLIWFTGIAKLLWVHLGVKEPDPKDKSQTASEKFHLFRQMQTTDWHVRRHQLAQLFLDKFVRQNIAEIDEIKSEEITKRLVLTPAEQALYLELDHHLQAVDIHSFSHCCCTHFDPSQK
jgi:hypothetical protein